jgi:hypothetical protein
MNRVMALFIVIFVTCAFLIPGQTWAASGNQQAAANDVEGLGPQPPRPLLGSRFVVDRNGIIIDTKTGLQWFVGPDKDTNWHEAKAWVDSLTVDGGGWRMPSREEVKDLYRGGEGTDNIDPSFKISGGFVWTSETVGSSHAWGFCFDIGGDYWPRLTFCDTARAFAVRAGK